MQPAVRLFVRTAGFFNCMAHRRRHHIFLPGCLSWQRK